MAPHDAMYWHHALEGALRPAAAVGGKALMRFSPPRPMPVFFVQLALGARDLLRFWWDAPGGMWSRNHAYEQARFDTLPGELLMYQQQLLMPVSTAGRPLVDYGRQCKTRGVPGAEAWAP
jgi:hypothetical protein